MAYSDFTLADLETRFQLAIVQTPDLFGHVPPRQPSAVLEAELAENVPLALAIGTEKARSELLIAPVLVDARRALRRQVSLFSGIEFNVLPEQGLNGVCDFLLSRNTAQLFLRAPLVAVVEAKNENIKAGVPQCLAAMVAMQEFNRREQTPQACVYGAVTVGDNWKFLRLAERVAEVDVAEYQIAEAGRILGVLCHMLAGPDGAGSQGAAA